MWHESRIGMKKEKEYKIVEHSSSAAAEPVAGYGCAVSHVQALRSRIVDAVNETDDETRLMECLEMLHESSMPCVYTDEEFGEEIRMSEASGNMSHEDVLKYFAEWGFAR